MSAELRLEQEPEPENSAALTPASEPIQTVDQAPLRSTVQKKRKAHVPWAPVCGVVAILIFLGSSAWAFFNYNDDPSAASDLPREVARYRAAGLPFTADEVVPNVPEDQNAESYMTLASEQANGMMNAAQNIPSLLDAGDTEEAAQLAHLLDPAVRTAGFAASKPFFNFHKDWDLGPQILFPEMAQAKLLVKALAYHAEAEAAKGNARQAASDLRNGRKIAALIGQEPIIVGGLVSVASDEIILKAAERSAAHLANAPAALNELQEAIGEPVHMPTFGYMLRGEGYMALTLARNPIYLRFYQTNGANILPTIDPSDFVRGGLPSDRHARAVMDRILSFHASLAEYAKAHPNDPIRLSSYMARLALAYNSHHTTSYGPSGILFPTFSEAGTNLVKDQATLAATRALVEALIYRAQHGSFPNSLDQLPGDWKDPFTGKTLKMAFTHGGVRIYSLGEDGVDHGGLVNSDLQGDVARSTPDIVATYPPILHSSN